MVHATVRGICEVTSACLRAGSPDAVIDGVCIDSRAVSGGSLFVAFPGERVDGNDFVSAALEAGAGAVVMTREPGEDLVATADEGGQAIMVVENAETFVQELASWWRSQLTAVVVGVTGSNGKSTTRNMIASVLSTQLRTHSSEGNLNNLIGCPLTVLACPVDAEALVVEMGMDHLGELTTLSAVVRPHMAVITNVGIAHLAEVGSRDGIARAKSEIVEGLEPSSDEQPIRSRAFLWGEGDYMHWIADEVAAPHGVDVVWYGTAEQDDVHVGDVSTDAAGCPMGTVYLGDGRLVDVHLSISGAHNMLNALTAAAVGDAVGIEPANIAAGLAATQAFGNHQRVVTSDRGFTVIDDSYNANTDSMRVAIDTLCVMPAERRVACLGDMIALGPDEQMLHGVVGAYAAAKGVDELVCVGPLSRNIASMAHLMGMPSSAIRAVDTPGEATVVLREMLRPGDVLLVIASHGTHLEGVVTGVLA